MRADRQEARGWSEALRGGVAVAAGFVLLRFLLTPVRMQVLTRVLAPEDYGTVTLLSMSAHAMALVLSAGGFELLLRSLPAATPRERDGVFRSVFLVSSALGLGAGALMLLGLVPAFGSGSGAGAVSRVAVAALFLMFLHTLQRLYYLLGCRRDVRARSTQLLWSDAWFVAVLPWGLGASWTAQGAVWAWCGWMLIVFAATWRWVPLGRVLIGSGGGVPPGRMLATGLPMVPAILAEWTFRLVGQYVLLAKTDATTMALYALAFNIAGVGYVVGVPLVDALSAEFNAAPKAAAGAVDEKGGERRRLIVSRALRLVFAVSVPVGLAFVFLARPVVRLLAGPAFAATADLLPWAALIPLLLLLNLLLARVLLAEGRSPWAGAGSLAGAALALGLCLLWVGPYGARGVFVAVTSGLAAATGMMLWRALAVREVLPREAGWGGLLAGGSALAAAFAALARCDAHPMASLAAAGVATLAVAVGFGWLRRSDLPGAGASRPAGGTGGGDG